MLCLVTKSCPTLCNPVGCSPPNTLCLWAFSRQEYWSGFPCPPSGDPTQGSNAGLLYCRWVLYHLSHQGSPRILEWVASACSRRSSRPRNWTRVSCITGRFFTSWATRVSKNQISLPFYIHWALCKWISHLHFYYKVLLFLGYRVTAFFHLWQSWGDYWDLFQISFMKYVHCFDMTVALWSTKSFFILKSNFLFCFWGIPG